MTSAFKTATELSKDLKERHIKSETLVKNSLDRIKTLDPKTKAFLSTFEEDALKHAAAIDARYDAGEALPPFAGIPIAIKDNIHIKGKETTCASKILDGFIAPYTATAAQKCIDHGLIPIGKVNMDEFAMGSSTEYSAIQCTANPWNLNCVPGGSSGGSACC